MSGSDRRPRLLLVGGGSGLVGRHLLAEFSTDWDILSVHRHPSPAERAAGAKFHPADIAQVTDWTSLLDGVDLVVNVAWYRAGQLRRFRPLAEGILRLVAEADRRHTPRFVHVSVPDSPASLETGLPYMFEKRRIDRAIEASGLSYAIVRPTMLFAPRDKLVTVMLRTMHRYHRFPMFGSGDYHISPLAASDFARVVRVEAARSDRRNVMIGGPKRWRYRDLTDAMFGALRLRPRYFSLSPRSAVRLARLLEMMGSTLLYVYEVEWLLSDMLGLPPYPGLPSPLRPVEPFLAEEAARLRGTQHSSRG
ncbi:MAG TPA: NAD(P)H-binding protein [Thermoplasmata archaeon]|jgi:NADH dehydrogenase|nr:NAD(P)H-binding protein [Thermoplasmata archaeon]